jgi:hypothetical protein
MRRKWRVLGLVVDLLLPLMLLVLSSFLLRRFEAMVFV